MIIGNGNISKVIIDRDDVVFFASGVSDSSCTDAAKFARERDILLAQHPYKHLVYFSSLSIYRSDTPYNRHKRQMEKLVKDYFHYYTIVRIEVCAWATNPTTIHNVFRKKINNNEPVDIQNTFRYVVTVDEFRYWLSLIQVGEKSEMNIPGVRHSVQQIYDLVKEGKM